MIFTRNSEKKVKNRSAKVQKNMYGLKRLLKFMKPYYKKVIIAAICVILVNVTQLIKPYILKLVIDDFFVKRMPQKGFFTITTMGIAYFSVVVLSGFFSFAQVNIINKAGQQIMQDLRRRVFKIIQFLPLSYLDKNSSGRLITRATNDVEALSEMYTDVLMSLFSDLFLLIGIVYAMLVLNVELALVSFVVIPVMFLIIFLMKNKIKKNFTKMKALIGRINGFMAENISGMKIVQIFNGEKEKHQEFKAINDEYFKATLFQVWMNSILKPATDVFQNLAVAILIWYGMGKIYSHTLEIGVLYAFTTYIKQFFEPIADLADNYTTIQSALVSADRIFELLDQEDQTENIETGMPIDNMNGTIEFKNVWFSYNEGQDWVLKDVSFILKKGETGAFVGETGAGKTTIISLVSGFYKIQKGEILIDGKNIYDYKLEDLRKRIAVVLQDVFLFSGNIKTNIALNDNISEEIIKDALVTSCALDFVNKLPKGLEEPVMERGSTFSAGQRQLLSFARAIAHQPSILVLDEATANIDTHTERLIQQAIENVSRDRTTLIIAHRLSTIKKADKIIVLRHGKIIEQGNHDELIMKKGYYNQLVQESNHEQDSELKNAECKFA